MDFLVLHILTPQAPLSAGAKRGVLLIYNYISPLPYEAEGRAHRNCPVGCFSKEPACRGGGWGMGTCDIRNEG